MVAAGTMAAAATAAAVREDPGGVEPVELLMADLEQVMLFSVALEGQVRAEARTEADEARLAFLIGRVGGLLQSALAHLGQLHEYRSEGSTFVSACAYKGEGRDCER